MKLLEKENIVEDPDTNTPSPLIFFGHCLGGLIAFEVARLLQRDGIHLTHLVVSACVSPVMQNRFNRDKQGVVKFCYAAEKDLLARVLEMNGMRSLDFFASRKDILRLCVAAIRRDFFMLEKYSLHMMDDELYDPVHRSGGSALVMDVNSGVMGTITGGGRETRTLSEMKASSALTMSNEEDKNEEEEDFGGLLPAVLFRLHVPITTLLASDDETVSAEGVQQWAELTHDHVHVEIEPPLGDDEEEDAEEQRGGREDEERVATNGKMRGVCGGHNYLSRITSRKAVIECIRRVVENRVDG
jgi:surfactin synthase thioesterase subunit